MADGSDARGGRGTRRPSAGATGRGGSSRAAAEAAAPASAGHVCPVAFCPVGMALTFAEAARPEVVQHLMAAGQELMLAVKAMVDARAEAVAGAPGLEHG